MLDPDQVEGRAIAGWVYILLHQSGTTVKVGETRVSPKSRARDYAETYELKGFQLAKAYKVPEDARQDVERITHQKLNKYRLSGIAGAREIFSCSLAVAQKAVEEAIAQSGEGVRPRPIEEARRKDEEWPVGFLRCTVREWSAEEAKEFYGEEPKEFYRKITKLMAEKKNEA